MNLQGINTTAGIHQDSLRAWQPRQPLHKSLLALPTLFFFFFLIKGITNFLILRVTFNDLERIRSCLKLYSHYKQAVNFKLLVKLAVTPREQHHREEAQQNLYPCSSTNFRIRKVVWTSLILEVSSLFPRRMTLWSCRTSGGIWYMCWAAILARTPLSLVYKIFIFLYFFQHTEQEFILQS